LIGIWELGHWDFFFFVNKKGNRFKEAIPVVKVTEVPPRAARRTVNIISRLSLAAIATSFALFAADLASAAGLRHAGLLSNFEPGTVTRLPGGV